MRKIALVLALTPFLLAGDCSKKSPADITEAKNVVITLRNETLLPVHLLVRQEQPSANNRLVPILGPTRPVTVRLREHDNVLIRAHETNELDRRTCVLGAGHGAGAAVVSWVQGDAGAEIDCTTGWENSF